MSQFPTANFPVLALLIAVFAGCSEKMPDGPRDPTYPIKGQVFVDGKPVGNLQVKALPIGGAKHPMTPSTYTDNEGNFSIGTYEARDGAPEGEYGLVFLWGQYNLFSKQYGGPDKLKGKYLDPEKSEHKVTVGPGKTNDLGRIDLTTGDAAPGESGGKK